jgi:hypothetical protein
LSILLAISHFILMPLVAWTLIAYYLGSLGKAEIFFAAGL